MINCHALLIFSSTDAQIDPSDTRVSLWRDLPLLLEMDFVISYSSLAQMSLYHFLSLLSEEKARRLISSFRSLSPQRQAGWGAFD
jgi:hypothetical protein